MSGTLYPVATPIGNLGDFSPRAVETLETVDFIAAEDTRVSLKLLNHFQIKKPLVSYHEHNHVSAGQSILQRLLAGENCALVTDAGTPAVSDPGEDLVRLCAEAGVVVLSIPGCCAAVNALAVSGLPTGRFTFEGFLTVNKKNKTGNRHNSHHYGVFILFVTVKLTHLYVTVKFIGELFDGRSEHKTRLTPGCPEINKNGHRCFLYNFLGKIH